MTQLFNKASKKDVRRLLRQSSTQAERKLWAVLRSGQLGMKIRRQFSVGPYIVDFYVPSCRLIIELDGDSHFQSEQKIEYDKRRQCFLENLGLKLLRFTDDQIFGDLDGVAEVIKSALLLECQGGPTTSPSPSFVRRGI